jgi:PDZ domain-containing protein
LITVDASHRHPVQGDVMLSTVALDTAVDPLRLFEAWLQPNVDIVSRQDITQGQTPQQFATESTAEMDRSEQTAVVVALRRLGYPIKEHGDGALVTGVAPQTPADRHLQAGDVIVAAGGKPVSLVQDLTAAIHAQTPGGSITLTYDRPRVGRRTDTLELISCPTDVCGPAGNKVPFLGISLQTNHDHFDPPPFKVNIGINGVGGPSAGLAFTLGLLDELTTGNLTGGHKVASTGTIGLDETIGPIGGIALKTVAVARSGADVFLVPKDDPTGGAQYSAAVAAAKGHRLRVIAVGNLNDVLNALRSIGGNLQGITACTVCTSAGAG